MLLLDLLIQWFRLHQRAQRSILCINFLLSPILNIVQLLQLLLDLLLLATLTLQPLGVFLSFMLILSLLKFAFLQFATFLFLQLQLLICAGNFLHKLLVLLLCELHLRRRLTLFSQEMQVILQHTQLPLQALLELHHLSLSALVHPSIADLRLKMAGLS